MACKEQKRAIDGVDYTVLQFPTREGLRYKTRILKLVGPIVDGVKGDDELVLSTFTDKLGDDTVCDLIVSLLSKTFRNGKAITAESFDVDFAGEYLHLYKVVMFVVEANGFLGKANIVEILKKKLQGKASLILAQNSIQN